MGNPSGAGERAPGGADGAAGELNRAGLGISVAFPLTVVAGVQVRGRPAPGQVIEQDERAA